MIFLLQASMFKLIINFLRLNKERKNLRQKCKIRRNLLANLKLAKKKLCLVHLLCFFFSFTIPLIFIILILI